MNSLNTIRLGRTNVACLLIKLHHIAPYCNSIAVYEDMMLPHLQRRGHVNVLDTLPQNYSGVNTDGFIRRAHRMFVWYIVKDLRNSSEYKIIRF